jgi:hypothetical protein
MRTPRKYGHTSNPRMAFHHTNFAKPMVKSQPAHQNIPVE